MTEIENQPAASSASEIKLELNGNIPKGATTDSGFGSAEGSPLAEEPDKKPANGVTNLGAIIESPAAAPAPTPNDTPRLGPDAVVAAASVWCVDRDGPVKLRMGESGPSSDKPLSVPTALRNAVKSYGTRVALAWKADKKSEWKTWTYRQYYDDSICAAKGLVKLGLEPYNAVGIIGFNSPEWFIGDMAAILAGGLACGIYTTNSPEACQYVAENARANVLLVEDDSQLQKILAVRDNLPELKAIVQWRGELKQKYEGVLTWAEFMAVGKDVPDAVLEDRINAQSVNKCCTLIYTSGTTGNPKGVMLSHDNVTWTARMMGKAARLMPGADTIISYLPLSHIAAQLVDIYGPLLYGASIYFAHPDALKGSIAFTLRDVRPTAFLGVPRVWEKIQETMIEKGRANPGYKKKLAAWARGVGLKGNYNMQKGNSLPWGWTIAKKVVFNKVRTALGLDRCKIAVSAAAPITKETLEFFLSLNIPVTEIYGMSESTGPHTVSFPWEYRIGAVGKDLDGCSTKLDKPDKEGNGEICMNGRHVFMGYLDQEEKTVESIDSEGWLHSGDVGKKDVEGFLYITGRIKELIITAGGENVAPVPIEDNVKLELPTVSNCMLIGDKRKFLAMLLTFRSEVDEENGDAKDELAPATLKWLAGLGVTDVKTVSGLIACKQDVLLKSIQAGIDRANDRSTSRAQKVAKWTILPHDFTVSGGELGPTLKLRRPIVSKMYAQTIDDLYA